MKIWAEEADGLTISGGEPFDQAEVLSAILAAWRAMSPTSIIVFTGHDAETLAPWLAENPGMIDAMVTGPYRRDLPQTLALRGSDNQELLILTPLGSEFRRFDRRRSAADRRLDVMFDEDGGAWFAGIPEPGDFLRFRRALEGAGHRTGMSSDTMGAAREVRVP